MRNKTDSRHLRELLAAARHLTGAKVLAARLYGVGPVTALAMTCWLAGGGPVLLLAQGGPVRGLDITVRQDPRPRIGPRPRLSGQRQVRGRPGLQPQEET